MHPSVAIITRTKDRPHLLKRAIESVLNQSHTDWLHVIVNDHGCQATLEDLLLQYRPVYAERLLVLHHTGTAGMQNASNHGIEKSQSEHLCIHDDDDSWHPDFLQITLEHMAEAPAQTMGVVTQTIRVTEKLSGDAPVQTLRREHYMPIQNLSLFDCFGCNPFPPIAFLYRREAHDTLGLFNQRYDVLGDWDFHRRVLEAYDIDVIQQALANYHWREGDAAPGYGNTVTEGIPRHFKNFSIMSNDLLREDLKDGKLARSELTHLSKNLRDQQALQNQRDQQNQQILQQIQQLQGQQQHREHLDDNAEQFARDHHLRSNRSLKLEDRYLLLKLKQASRPFEYISLDVFDTCLHRHIQDPLDVFQLLEHKVHQLSAQTDLPVYTERVQAEQELAAQGDHPHLAAIAANLCQRLGLSKSWIPRLEALEQSIELSLCHANPVLLAFYTWARANGKTICFTSDSYHPAPFICKLLNENGFTDANVLSSCQQGASKHEGSLFERTIATLDVAPERILHIGDHPISDILRAEQRKLKTFCVPQHNTAAARIDEARWLFQHHNRDLLSRLTTGAARAFRRETLNNSEFHTKLAAEERSYFQIGYECVGPLHFAYAHFIAKKALQRGIRDLHFLSRDGYYLKQVFDKITEHYQLPLRSHYTHSSRWLNYCILLSCFPQDAGRILLAPHAQLTVGDMLRRMGMQPEDELERLTQVGLPDLDEQITSSDGQYISEVYRQRLAIFLELSREQTSRTLHTTAQSYTAYLTAQGVFKPDSAIVDIGWRGTSLETFHLLARLAPGRHCPHGYFLGTTHETPRQLIEERRFDAFLVTSDQPTKRRALLAESISFIELCFQAPHPSTTGIERQDDQSWQAVHAQHAPQENTAWHQHAFQAVLRFTDDMLRLNTGLLEADGIDYIEGLLERLLRHPSKQEAQHLGKLIIDTSFSLRQKQRCLAQVPKAGWLRRQRDLQQAYSESLWKKGFLAQLNHAQLKQIYKTSASR